MFSNPARRLVVFPKDAAEAELLQGRIRGPRPPPAGFAALVDRVPLADEIEKAGDGAEALVVNLTTGRLQATAWWWCPVQI
jgi:hypothetical protein